MNHSKVIPSRAYRFYRSNVLLLIFFLATAVITLINLNVRAPEFSNLIAPGNGESPQTLVVSPVPYDLVFVSRKINKHGVNNIDSLNAMPGAGTHSRFRIAAPGKLQIYKTDGTLITLIDGSNPTNASLNLIDVSSPEVSYDGTQIVFAGLPAPVNGSYDTLPNKVLGAWRIYKINVNGTGLTQLTFSDQNLSLGQFNNHFVKQIFSLYDDMDPVWMPDGRICFSSTRYHEFTHWAGTLGTNLFVMDSSGANMHRITTERNGADRPLVDPLTGQIVFSRWWRNQRVPIDDMSTVPNNNGTGYIMKDGLSSDPFQQKGGPFFNRRNGWHLASINPDGTNLKLFSGGSVSDLGNQAYGGSFTSTGDVITYVNLNVTLAERGGFGGIRKMKRGIAKPVNLIGLTDNDPGSLNAPVGTPDSMEFLYSTDGYAADPEVMPDGKIVVSWCSDYRQDYGLYRLNSNGTSKKLIYNAPGTSEMHARAIRVRSTPTIISDVITQVASALPPLENGPYNVDGTFNFNCLNVYANGPVDMDIPNAPAVGSAASIRFFIDHQRQRFGSFEQLEWPILLTEIPVSAGGAVSDPNAPANVPLFEQIRTSVASGYAVPFTGLPFASGTAHVSGLNYGRPGATATCVGCHRNHTLQDVPVNPADAEWSNLAPGATVTTSSSFNPQQNNFLVDRKVQLALSNQDYWVSSLSSVTNQWALLGFDVPIKVRKVKVYNIPNGGSANSSLQVNKIKVFLYADKAGTQLITSKTYNQPLTATGKTISFTDVTAQSVKVQVLDFTGTYSGFPVSGLAEIEVIGSGNTGVPKYFAAPKSIRINVYPSPVTDILNINIEGLTDEIFHCDIFDIAGRLVKQSEINDTDETVQISLSELKAGVYFVKVKSKSTEKTVKIFKE